MGCEQEVTKRQRRADVRYSGFINTVTQNITSIRTAKGHGFAVIHAPEEGEHHAKTRYAPAAGTDKLNKAEKGELNWRRAKHSAPSLRTPARTSAS
jgi:hypothetical protein